MIEKTQCYGEDAPAVAFAFFVYSDADGIEDGGGLQRGKGQERRGWSGGGGFKMAAFFLINIQMEFCS